MGEHPAFNDDNFEKVAVLEASSAEQAFELTNHIDREWRKNSGILRYKQSRSTSVGDVIAQDDGKLFRVEPVGMHEFSEKLSAIN